jgi:F0F1-type ATP synthase gamma subunit
MLLEKEASDIIDMIVNNRNFILDKKLWEVDENKPVLNIYFGSDYGFCGSINFQINQMIAKDDSSQKLLIGKKLRSGQSGVIMKISREDFLSKYEEIEKVLENSIRNREHSQINLVYNHFYNTSNIELANKKIFPFDIGANGKGKYKEDYYVEGDANTMLISLVTLYLNYEVKIADVNSFASENIMRQNSTSESLKKIDEREEEEKVESRRFKMKKEFGRVIESYIKKKGIKGEGNENR